MSPIGNYCLASIAILYIWHSIFCTICGENEGYLQIFMWVLRLMNEFVMDFFFLMCEMVGCSEIAKPLLQNRIL